MLSIHPMINHTLVIPNSLASPVHSRDPMRLMSSCILMSSILHHLLIFSSIISAWSFSLTLVCDVMKRIIQNQAYFYRWNSIKLASIRSFISIWNPRNTSFDTFFYKNYCRYYMIMMKSRLSYINLSIFSQILPKVVYSTLQFMIFTICVPKHTL